MAPMSTDEVRHCGLLHTGWNVD
ncbi:hypothetical protein MNBD_ALPHA07-1003, partial [hydrothermal vent metagenome]